MLSCNPLFRNGIALNIRLLATSTNLCRPAESNVSRTTSYYEQRGLKEEEEAAGKPADWDAALPYQAIPGPKPLPIIGNTHQFLFGKYKRLDYLELNQALYAEFGKIAAIRELPSRRGMVFLYNPEDIEKMHRNEGIWPNRDIMPALTEYRKKTRKEFFDKAPGIITVQGEEWFNMRSKVNPILMQPRPIKNYTEGMNEVANDCIKMIKRLSKENTNHLMPKNFESHIQNCNLEGMGYIALNRRFGCLSDNPPLEALQLVDHINRIFDCFYILEFHPLAKFYKMFKTKTWRTFVRDMDFMTDTIQKHIDEAQVEIKNRQNVPSDGHKSVLEKLLAVNENVANTMVIDMIFAGVDTTTKTIGSTLYYLAKNKTAQKKLQEELKTIMSSPDSPITVEGLDKANYLKAAIKESMRLSPIAIVNLRTSTKEIVLGGYQIPKGVDVMACTAVISRHKEYFVRPDEFLPERWLRSTTDELSQKNTSPFVSLPFGFGPRSCVGQRVANLSLQVFIAKVFRNFEVEWPHKDMKFKTDMIHGCADPLEFKMTPLQD